MQIEQVNSYSNLLYTISMKRFICQSFVAPWCHTDFDCRRMSGVSGWRLQIEYFVTKGFIYLQ